MEPAGVGSDEISEVWALGGSDAVAKRTRSLVGQATDEIVMVVGVDELLGEEILDSLADATDEVDVVVGAVTESGRDRIRETVPGASVFVSGLEWLDGSGVDGETAVGRLLLVDRESILVSTVEDGQKTELVIFGRGFGNGLVVTARRLISIGLIPAEDPGQA